MESQKNDQSVSKKKIVESGDYSDWGTDKEKKRYVMGMGSKISTRGVQGGKLQE